jgi:hypothetical protein
MLKTVLALSTAIALALAPTTAAFAQPGARADREKNVSVLERPRPDYDAIGINLGGFTLFPSLSAGVERNDDVFFDATNRVDDWAYASEADARLQSNWSRHGLAARIGFADRRFQDVDSENRTDESAAIDGRLDIGAQGQINAGASFRNFGEGRSSPNAPGGAAKLGDVDSQRIYIGATQVFNRIRLNAEVSREDLDFDPIPLTSGGFDDANNRDREETELRGRIDFGISPDTSIYLEAAREEREYDTAAARAAGRNSEGTTVLVGLRMDISGALRGEVAAGQIEQDYDSPAIDTVDGTAVKAKVEWFPTQLTSVTLDAERTIEDAVVAGTSSYLETTARVRVDHELRRNVLLNGFIGSGERDFRGLARKDDLIEGGLGARWLINRSVEANISWRKDKLDSGGALAANDYDSDRILVGVTLRR